LWLSANSLRSITIRVDAWVKLVKHVLLVRASSVRSWSWTAREAAKGTVLLVGTWAVLGSTHVAAAVTVGVDAGISFVSEVGIVWAVVGGVTCASETGAGSVVGTSTV